MKSILFSLTLVFTALACFAQDYYGNNRKQWLQKAEQYKPKLIITEKKPLKVVDIVPDTQSFQKYKAVDVSPIDSLYSMPFRLKKEITIDFGEHLTGYFSFSVRSTGLAADGPLRFKLTFGEVPSEVAVSFDSYKEGLSRAWLQDEVVSVMYVPQTVTLPRRLAFRYIKIELLGSSPYYDFNIHDMKCMAQTSAKNIPEELPQAVGQDLRA